MTSWFEDFEAGYHQAGHVTLFARTGGHAGAFRRSGLPGAAPPRRPGGFSSLVPRPRIRVNLSVQRCKAASSRRESEASGTRLDSD